MKYIEVKEWKGTDWEGIAMADIYEAQTILCNKEGAEWWNNHQTELSGFEAEQYLINFKEGIEEYTLKGWNYEPVEDD